MSIISHEMIFILVIGAIAASGVILYRIRKNEVISQIDKQIIALFRERYPNCSDCSCKSLFIRDRISIYKMYNQPAVWIFQEFGRSIPCPYTKTMSVVQHHGQLICSHCNQVIYLYNKKESLELNYHMGDFLGVKHTLNYTDDGMPCITFDKPVELIEEKSIHSPREFLKLLDYDPAFLPLPQKLLTKIKEV